MKKAAQLLVCALALHLTAHAAYTPIALTPGSYNYDAVVENTAPPPLQALVTANMDAGTNIAGLVGGNGTNHASFTELGVENNGSCGLPLHGSTFVAASDTNHAFQMPADYTTNNAIFIGGSQSTTTQVPSGTFTLTSPGAFKKLSVLNAAGSGPATVSYTVNFQGGATEQGTFTAYDWLSTNAPDTNITAVVANGYFQGTDASLRSVNVTPKVARLFYNDITLANTNGIVMSVDFSYTVNNSRVAIFGLSSSTNGTNFSPVAVTGFNYDMVIEALLPTTVNATADGGTNVYNNSTWYEQGYLQYPNASLPLSLTGLPHPGTSFTALSNANITFKMPPSYTSNNAIMLDSSSFSGAFIPATPTVYKKLAVLTSANGTQVVNYLVIHTDFSVESGTFTNQNWNGTTATNNIAFIAGGHVSLPGNGISDPLTTTATKLYYFTIPVSSSVPVARIQFTQSSGRSWMFALSADASGTDVFSPIEVTGFNFDLVVEAQAKDKVHLHSFTTVTPGGGTNNSGNSFYEQGWNPLAPTSGLPPANSLVTSTNFPDRQYRMAPSYSAANVIYVDTNNPVADITFATPTNYTTLSFLNTANSGQLQAQVVVHYDGAPSITNTLFIRDWFINGPPSAYTVAGLVNTDLRGANSWVPVSTVPRLFENQITLPGLSNNITGFTFRWTTNNGSGGMPSVFSRIFLFAVSGVLPAEPIINVQPTNSALGYGTTTTLSVDISGAYPMIFQWQSAVSGSAVFTNVVDGGNISGANTSTLTFNPATYANNADYRLVIINSFGSITSSVAKVVVVLPYQNLLTPSDAIQGYNGAPASSGQGITHAIDGLLSKYLRFNANSNPPYNAPLGLTVTPTVGESTVYGVRLFTADDHPERDPIDFELDGSNDGGSNWTFIASNSIAMPAARNPSSGISVNLFTNNYIESGFLNSATYTSYRLFFRNVKTNAAANCLQLAEVQLLGTPSTNPPAFVADLPSMELVNIGDTLVLPTKTTGGGTITYGWKKNGIAITNSAKISGAQSNVLSITMTDTIDTGAYQVFATNAYGSTASALAAISVAPATDFNTNGVGWAMNGTNNGVYSPATITSNVLTLTTGVGIDRSAFLTNRVNVTGFLATYTYQNASAGGADGVAFVLQNDPRGTAALGAGGGSLGASNIKPSIAVQFNIYNAGVVGMAINTNGFVGNFQSTAPVNIVSGHPIDISVRYLSGLLEVTLTDAITTNTFKTNWTVNLPSVVGGDAAYVGFTGASGGVGSTQTISNFVFTPFPIVTAKLTNNTAEFSWPALASSILQSSTNLGSFNWIAVTNKVTVTTNAALKINTTLDQGRKFYRLQISNP